MCGFCLRFIKSKFSLTTSQSGLSNLFNKLLAFNLCVFSFLLFLTLTSSIMLLFQCNGISCLTVSDVSLPGIALGGAAVALVAIVTVVFSIIVVILCVKMRKLG